MMLDLGMVGVSLTEWRLQTAALSGVLVVGGGRRVVRVGSRPPRGRAVRRAGANIGYLHPLPCHTATVGY
jgi:hypothetical protein